MDEISLPQENDLPTTSAGIRMGKALLKATRPFAVESVSTWGLHLRCWRRYSPAPDGHRGGHCAWHCPFLARC